MLESPQADEAYLSCDSTDAAAVKGALLGALRTQGNDPLTRSLEAPINSRGSDAAATVQWVLNVDIDLAKCLWACAATLIVYHPKFRVGNFMKVLRRIEDVRAVYKQLTGSEPLELTRDEPSEAPSADNASDE